MTSPAIRVLQLAVVALALPIAFMRGYSTAVPAAKTFAPGEGGCNECHLGAPNSRAGRVEVQFASLLTYRPGLKQTLAVRVYPGTVPGTSRGFQLAARLAGNPQAQAGTFTITDVNTTSQTQDGIQYVNHSRGISANSYGGSAVFNVEWTPPTTNVGNIRFYVSGVDGNADFFANALDAVYSANYTLTPDTRELPEGYRWTTFNAGTNTFPKGISNDGRIVGTFDSGANKRGFLRSATGDLTTIQAPNSVSTFANGVNASGVVAGTWTDSNGREHGFIRSAQGAYDTRDIPAAIGTSILGINDAGVISGSYRDSNLMVHAFTMNGGTTTFDGPELGNTVAWGINSSNNVAATFSGRNGILRTPTGYFIDLRFGCATTETGGASHLRLNDFHDVVGNCTESPNEVLTSNAILRGSSGRRAPIRRQGGGAADSFQLTGINNSNVLVGGGVPGAGGYILTPCSLTLTAGSVTLDSGGGTGRVNVTGPSDCQPVLTTDSDWITIQDNGNFTVGTSTSASLRTGNIYLGSQVFTVNQAAIACSFIFSGSPTVDQAGGTALLSVIAPAGCAWNPVSTASWIALVSSVPNPGTGSGTLTYVVSQNSSGFGRSGAILVGGVQFVINQLSGTGTGCSYQVIPSSTTFPIEGGAGAVSVITPITCTWNLNTNETWISLSSLFFVTGNGAVSFTVQPNTGAAARTGTIFAAGQIITISQAGSSGSSALRFVPVTPCRVADTRAEGGKTGSFGPPRISANTSRDIPIPLAGCNVPSNARAYSLNITAVPPGLLSFITAYPTGQNRPLASTLNSFNGRVVANASVVPAGTNGSVTLYGSNDTDAIVDINGYFISASEPNGLAFYPLAPCRVADTRPASGKSGEYGAPSITGGGTRTFNMVNAGCGIPGSALAYSLNVTAVPPGPLSYITIWPGGQTQPVVSTLNAFDGSVVANAAIVPAGTNSTVNVFASNTTDVVIDVNGYFAPIGGFGALNFYAVTPCRAVDTRNGEGKTGQFGPPQLATNTLRTFNLTESGCGVPPSARGYSVNVTVVPPGPLGYLTIWPADQAQPFVSTLNSFNGQVVANAALVPAAFNGGVSVFVSNATDVIIDVNGYFAP